MKIIKKIEENKNLSLALGYFDGVHRAHKEIISKTVEIAKENSLKSAVLTFEKSPASYFLNEPFLNITTNEKKAELIEKLGVDFLYVLNFEEVKNINAKDYIENILIKNFSPKFVITGYNHTFGLNRTGDSSLLSNYPDFRYIKINEMKNDNLTISSTNIKNFIKNGNITEANKMLGRNFSIRGKVVKGNQIARKLGYKTANIIWNNSIIKPKYGVYSGFANYRNIKYKALINFGIRPTVDKNLIETLEAHIFNFDFEIYNEILEVEFLSKIRDEVKFNSLLELKTQIEKDVNSIT